MRENFLAALGAVLPMALLMALGAGTRRAGVVDRPTMRRSDYVFTWGKIKLCLCT